MEILRDLNGLDLRPFKDYETAIFIFQGEHDWQTPTSLVKPWFETINAPHKQYIAFENSAHLVVTEEFGKYLHTLIGTVRPFAIEQGLTEELVTECLC